MSATQQDRPDYDVEIDADELLRDLADRAGKRWERMNERERHHREYVDAVLDMPEPGKLSREQLDALEHLGALEAYSNAIAMLQPESEHWKNFRDGDTVDVRGFMREMSRLSERENEARSGDYTKTRQASGAHTAYAKVVSLVRDDYGVGWPRIDDIGGVVEEDLP